MGRDRSGQGSVGRDRSGQGVAGWGGVGRDGAERCGAGRGEAGWRGAGRGGARRGGAGRAGGGCRRGGAGRGRAGRGGAGRFRFRCSVAVRSQLSLSEVSRLNGRRAAAVVAGARSVTRADHGLPAWGRGVAALLRCSVALRPVLATRRSLVARSRWAACLRLCC